MAAVNNTGITLVRRWIAVHAVWLLLIQAALGGFVAGQAAAMPSLPLCAAGKTPDPGDTPGHPGDLPACCSAGCIIAMPAAPLPEAGALALAPAPDDSAIGAPAGQGPRREARRAAHAPRAPPAW